MKVMTGRVREVLLLMPLLAGLAGCSVVQARTPPVVPPLNAPDPPARILVPPVDPPAAPPAASPGTPSRAGAAPPPPARPPDRGTPPPPTPPPADTPAQILQTTPLVAEVEKRIQLSLDNAKSDLGKVVVGGLSRDGQAQYVLAWQLVRNATEQLTSKNYSLAENLAGKAALLARLLVKR
jgi:hypothetical protein